MGLQPNVIVVNRAEFPHKIVLGSGSPRRRELLSDLGYTFSIKTADVDETPPIGLDGQQIAEYLAKHKAQHIDTAPNEVLITSDTVVWHRNASLAKPADRNEAIEMITRLSGDTHQVITGVCLRHDEHLRVFSDVTEVKFKTLAQHDIEFYVDIYKPFDKAGAYGIQEWIGMIGIEYIRGSYFNVVGLPVEKLDAALLELV